VIANFTSLNRIIEYKLFRTRGPGMFGKLPPTRELPFWPPPAALVPAFFIPDVR
jgi:hypothetical protein